MQRSVKVYIAKFFFQISSWVIKIITVEGNCLYLLSLLFVWDISKEFWNVKIAEESANRFLRKTFEFIAWFEYSIGSSKKQYFELKNIPQKIRHFYMYWFSAFIKKPMFLPIGSCCALLYLKIIVVYHMIFIATYKGELRYSRKQVKQDEKNI